MGGKKKLGIKQMEKQQVKEDEDKISDGDDSVDKLFAEASKKDEDSD